MSCDVIFYILSFLLQSEDDDIVKLVSYGESENARIVIDKSSFFNDDVYMTSKSLPVLPLKSIDGMPILFGNTKIYELNGKIHIGADLIASSFFLLSRYEECVRREVRDVHGRFIGKESLPYRAGFINRPIVDEYGAFLRKILRNSVLDLSLPEPDKGFSHIWMTHDIDRIWSWESFYKAAKTTVGNIVKKRKNKFSPIKEYLFYKNNDPIYTFPYIVKQDNKVRSLYGDRCSMIYFVVGCFQKNEYDSAYIKRYGKTKRLIKFLKKQNSEIGCHISYSAPLNLPRIKKEIETVSKISGSNITKNRNHYLASREPEDFLYLIDNGITDDFTMGYADVVGFRLGTCRAVRWINPNTLELDSLILHPMMVMDCTLDGVDYMNIQDEELAFNRVSELIDNVYENYGEVVLLWHNTSFSVNSLSYHTNLYNRTVELLRKYTGEKYDEK